MVELVDLMAENTHKVWAQDRIQQGWTYGQHEVKYFFKIYRLLHTSLCNMYVIPNKHFLQISKKIDLELIENIE